MEGRQMMSASPLGEVNPGGPIIIGPGPVIVGQATTHSVGLKAEAGVSWTGDLGKVDFPYLINAKTLEATVNWGDGTTLDSDIVVRQTAPGEIVIDGTHTYANAGKYEIQITVETIPPVITPMNALIEPLVLAKFDSSASIRPDVGGGASLLELVGQKFTAGLGTFVYNNVDLAFNAVINWGDGTTSSGMVVRDNREGFNDWIVVGTHNYSKISDYKVEVSVYAHPVGSNIVPTQPLTTFTADIKTLGKV